jgi:hypothetical protein
MGRRIRRGRGPYRRTRRASTEKTGANDFYNPNVSADDEDMTDENVWNIRGHLATSYCFSTDYPRIEGGTDIKRKFVKRLAPLGEDIMHKFFRTNSELLLPSLPTITGEPVFR